MFLKKLCGVFFLFAVGFFVSSCSTYTKIDRSSDLYYEALTEPVIYDRDYDYVNLGRFANLPIYPKGYRGPKKLIDHVIVNKANHQMFLMKKDKVIRSYWIALSDKPVGDKQYEGDKRTPEGTYTLDYINYNSNYYKSFHISYPNDQDIEEAKKLGKRPGGMIMIHGQPYNSAEYHATVQRSDWTDGCIAILNPEMDEFISLVDPGTPITINP